MKPTYYPKSISLKNYKDAGYSVVTILGTFFSAVFLISLVGYAWINAVAKKRTHLPSFDRFAAIWFMICGFIHCFLEGYFVLHHASILPDMSFFGAVWKEYAISDSRYLTSDPSVLMIEAITAFIEGPLCFPTAYAIVYGLPFRHALQILISMGQLYGCILYYATSAFEGFLHSNPAPQYFYGYFVFMNLPWVVFPFLLILQSVKAMNSAFSATKAKRQ